MNIRQVWKLGLRLVFAAAVVSATLLSYQPAQGSTYTVFTTDDSGAGSLRSAILSANLSAGPHLIQFNIPGCVGACVIQPSTKLPDLTSGGVTIDGYTQIDASVATASAPAVIKVELDGRYIIVGHGLTVTSSDNVIRGLSIHRFQYSGIAIGTVGGSVANNNRVQGNYLGVTPDGAFSLGNSHNGVFVGLGAQNNQIGGTTPGARNVISANGGAGVGIHGAETSGNIVRGNYIGTNIDGNASLGNNLDGVWIYGGAHDNTVGGDTAWERNLLSGNVRNGLRIEGAESDNNQATGNFIGLNASSAIGLGNGHAGVYLYGAPDNTIGPDNVIASNDRQGVRIQYAAATGNLVFDNIIFDNGDEGVNILENAADSIIGPDNLISSNDGMGVWIDGTHGNHVYGNLIGTDPTGSSAFGNDSNGVMVSAGAQNNLIGGDTPAERNVISGNESSGIQLADTGTISNTVSGNYIGLAANGTQALFNDGEGVRVGNGVQNTTIGGDTLGERNIISGNQGYGIVVNGADASGIVISGNYIGTDASGMVDLGNRYTGIYIYNGAHDILIGGSSAAERNLISGNDDYGIDLWGSGDGLENIVVSGNYIGLGANGGIRLGNDEHGISIGRETTNCTIGGDTPAERNIISANGRDGIYMSNDDVTQNTVSGNYIGTNASGTRSRGNGRNGVHISIGANQNTIGPHNLIAFNAWDGVRVDTLLAIGNLITENSIYSNGQLGIDLTNGANNQLAAPVISSVRFNPLRVVGTACPGCLVEIFLNPNDDGEGKTYLGSATADIITGAFRLRVDYLAAPYLTATATDSTDGTSEFSAAFENPVQVLLLPMVVQ